MILHLFCNTMAASAGGRYERECDRAGRHKGNPRPSAHEPVTAFSMKMLCIAVLSMLGFIVLSATAHAEDYVFVLPLRAVRSDEESKGASKHSPSQMLTKLCDILSAKTGDNFTCTSLPIFKDTVYSKENIEEFIAKLEALDYSAVYLTSTEYYEFLRSGYDKMVPALSVEIFKKTDDRACFFMRPGELPENIEALRGKRWGGSYFHIETRYIFKEHGIDEKPGEFFGEIVFDSDDYWDSMAYGLLDGNFDVFTGIEAQEPLSKLQDERFKSIEKGFCTKYRASHVIAFNKELSREKVEDIRKIMLKAHKDTDFAQFRFIFAAIQGRFAPFDKETFALTEDYVEFYRKKGWLDDQIAFIDANTEQ